VEIDKFRVVHNENTWELWLGDSSPEMTNGRRFLKLFGADRPVKEDADLILERLNGFPKAIEFIYQLSKKAEDPGSHSNTDTVALIDDFLNAVPHKHSLLKQEEPKPREFNVTIARTIKATVNVVATSKEEAAELVWERGDQIGEAFEMTERVDGDEAYEDNVSNVEEAE